MKSRNEAAKASIFPHRPSLRIFREVSTLYFKPEGYHWHMLSSVREHATSEMIYDEMMLYGEEPEVFWRD